MKTLGYSFFYFSDNFLNCLPQTVGKLSSLRTLDISGTNQVFYLPKTFCHIQTLEVLLLAKPHCMEYPPPSMCKIQDPGTINTLCCCMKNLVPCALFVSVT